MIELKNVSYGYEDSSVIKNISITIQKGEFVAIIGANGAGKSTVSKLIRGLLCPSEGSVFINGTDTKKEKASSFASQIGFLFQNPDRQICKNTVREELLFSLECADIDKEQQKEMLAKTLQSLNLNEEDAPFMMSRGERQKVALASVLVNEPEILILDEPTTGLDYKECIQIMKFVKILNEKGITVIMVTHDMEIVLDYAKRALLMNRGELVADGNPKDIFYEKETMKKASILPPQIVELSMCVGDKIGRVYSAEEMTEKIMQRKEVSRL